MKKIISRIPFLLVLALSLVFLSCDSWMSGNNFFDTISDEVKYANAPVISVYVRYPNRTMGETSPNGNSRQKVDIPFSITAVDSDAYGFYKWAAFSSTDSKYSTIRQYSYIFESEESYQSTLGKDELGEDVVVFEDSRNFVTTAKVLTERNDVFIMPICVRRPYIASSNPANGAVDVVKNQTVDIVFSKPMDPYFLVKSDGTLNTEYVSIQAFRQVGEVYLPGGDISEYLPEGTSMQAKLSTSKKTLSISMPVTNPPTYWQPQKSFSVTVSYQAKDTLGYEMSKDGEFSFGAGSDLDSISPVVMELEVGTNHLKKHTTEDDLPRVGNTLNVRAVVGDRTKQSDSTATENNVAKIGYRLDKLQSPSNTLNLGSTTGINYIDEYPYASGFVATDEVELSNNQTGSGTTFPVDIRDYDDGLWKLSVWGVDKTGNSGDSVPASNAIVELSTSMASEASTMYIYFVKDTWSPADTNSSSITAQTEEAPYGWYNPATLSNIKMKESTAGAIVDSPNYNNAYKSKYVWWAFHMGDGADTWRSQMAPNSTAWHKIDAVTNPNGESLASLLGVSSINSSSVPEGTVNVSVMFKDDVGNMSSAVSLDSVKYDGTKPVTGALEWNAPSGVPEGFANASKLTNQTLKIPFTETLSGVKKISITVDPPSGNAGYMPCKKAFDASDFNAKIKTSSSGYSNLSFTKATNTDNGVQEIVFADPLLSSTTNEMQNYIYLDNLKIADYEASVLEGIYTVKVKLYDTALNEAVEKTVEVFVDKTAPKIEKMLVEEAVKYQASATGTKKYYLTSSAYSSSAAIKVTLDLEFTEKTSGIYEITLGSDAALTSDSKVLDSAGNQITNVETVGSTTIRFTNKSTAPRDDDKFTLKITNISLGSYTGSREIVASVKDYATLADNNFKKLSFAGDSALYDEIWMDASNISRSAPDAFTVTGKETGIEGYTKTVNLDASLTLPIITESGVKKIKLSGLKANSGATGTKIYKGSTTTTPLGYQLEDDGATIVLNYPIVNTSNTTTLNFTGLELTSLTEGSNSLSAKYEFLTGWESPAKTTTVIYDTVAPVIGSSTESMTWVVKDDASEIPGVSSSATINGQYLVIPVTETNSGVRKIKIEVKKENTEGNMVATTAASCASVAYVGYGTAGTSRVGATTLSPSYWSKSGNELTILDPVNYGKAAYYYIRGIKISDTTSVAEGNYTLHVTLYDYAGNVSGEKTIDMCNDHTSPVVKDSWFDGVVNNASSLSAPRTYTTHSENNTLFIKVEEGGSGIQTIYLHHYFGWDPYNNTLPSCRTIATTSNTKLYKSLDNGATFTEVPCTTGGTSPSYYLKVSNENAIRSTAENDVILKITGLEILATDYADRCAASVSVYMYDFAQNQSSWDTTHNNDKDNPTLAAIAEDRDQADIDQATLTITDSEKVLQGENLVAESGTYTAYTGYTNNPLVNIKFVANEYQHRPSPTSSGIRAFVLEGAKFTEKTVLQWREMKGDYSYGNSSTVMENANFNSRTLNDQFTAVYNGSKDSIAEVPFAYDTNKFYLVGDNILVVETPISTGTSYDSAPNYFYINYVQLTNTSSDGSKQVKLKIYDTAGTYLKADGTLNEAINTSRPNADSSWPNNHEGSGSITYCATAPTITVNDIAKSDPATITAANIQTLMPTTNGLQAYAEGTTVWTFSHSTQGNRNGSNSTPLGNGVYLYNSYCPYFDLDITPSTAANLRYYKWTNSDTVPASGWNPTSSNKVNVNFPTSGDVSANSVTAKDIYLHVADYAGNVTTKKMSQCQWINETVQDAWPKRKDDTGKKMENGVYYLESDGFYATDIPRLTVTLPAGTSGDVKVYIPTDWFNKVCDNGAPIYGYAMGNHTRYDEGHTDISKAKRDATGPYLEIPQSYITEATAQSTNYAEFYFYVYDAVGQDLTAVVRVTVDSTPPLLQVNVSPAEAGKLKWAEESSIVELSSATSNYESWRFGFANSGNNTGDAFAIQGGNEMFRRATLNKGFSAANPIVLYSSSNALKVMLYTTTTDILEYKYSINDGTPITLQYTAEHQYISSITIPGTPGTEQRIKFSAIDKGANVTNLYFKVYVDNQGPTISATDVQKVNQITETSGGTSEVVNYFGSQATAKISISDEYAGLSSANGGFSTDSVNLVNDLPEPTSDKSLVISVSDRFGNASNSSMTYNGSNKWVKDITAPGTPSLTYNSSNPLADNNTIISSYSRSGANGLTVTHSNSTWSVTYSKKVRTITLKPSATDTGSDVMGYVSVTDSSNLKDFYTEDQVFKSSKEYTVRNVTTSNTYYIYAVDKAGNRSANPLTITLAPAPEAPVCTNITYSGVYFSGQSGWFKQGGSITVTASGTPSPSKYYLEWGTGDNDYTEGTYSSTSNTIVIPDAASGAGYIKFYLNNGEDSDDYYIEGRTLTSPTVTSWTLDKDGPTGIGITSVTRTTGKVYRDTTSGYIYFNDDETKLSIKPTASDGGSGIKGYALDTSGSTNLTTVTHNLSDSKTSVTIYAYDNVGNYSSQNFTLVEDKSPPSVTPGTMTGCTQIGSTWYFKDDSAKLTLSIIDTGSGVSASSPLKNNAEITLSDYKDDSGTKIVIPSNRIIDNVGNTDTYVLVSNIVQDSVAPNPPGSVSYVEATDGKAVVSGNTVYFNGDTTAVTLTLSGQSDAASGLDGFVVTGATASAVEGYKTSKISIPTSSLGDSTSITIQAKDGVGNVSTGYTVILKKDASAPSVTISLTEVENSIYKSGSNYYFKNPGSNYAKFTLTIIENGVGLHSSSLTSGTYNISDYYDETHKIKIDSGLIKDALGNTTEYTSEFLVYNDTSAPSIESGNFTVTGNPTIGTESKTSTTPVTWYKSGFKLYIENCESGGSGLAYWQIGTTQTKKGGTYVSSTSEGDTGTITLPATLTTPTVLYIYAEDHLGNSASTKLSTIDSSYKDNWACDTSADPSAPAISAITSIVAKVGSDTSAGYAHLDSTHSKLYYNASASAMTITMSSELPDDVIGYNLTGNASSGASTTLDVTTIPSDAIKIYAVDYKGKVSYRLKLTLEKDETAPTFTQPSAGTPVTVAKAANGWNVNTYQSGAKLTIAVSDGDSGSGLAAYSLVYNVNEYTYSGNISWTAATGNSIEVTLPTGLTSYNTDLMLLLKDNVGNVTKADNSGNYGTSAGVKIKRNGNDDGWWYSIPASPSFGATCTITGEGNTSMAVTLTGVKVPVSKIEVTATGITGIKADDSGKNIVFRNHTSVDEKLTGTYNNGTITLSNGPYLSYDGTITFTLTGTGIELPTCIKLNGDDSLKVTSGFTPSVFAGFRRFGMQDRYLVEEEPDTTPGPVLQSERRITVQPSFIALANSPAVITDDEQVNFNIGKNMGIVEESRIAPDTVTVGEEVGYNSEAYDTDNLPLQNHAWKAPDGPIFEEEDLALNMVPGSDASGQLFTATDAGGVKDEQKQGLDPALILALLSLCGLGLAAVFIRKRTV